MSSPPTSWLSSLAAAWPLRSSYAFTHALPGFAEFHRSSWVGIESQSTSVHKTLASELENDLRPRARGLSLKQLELIRRSAWARDSESIHEHLQNWGRSVLVDDGGRCRLGHSPYAPKTDCPNHTARVKKWRWMSLALPIDLFVAACTEGLPHEDWVELGTTKLRDLLEEGVAETHVHMGGALSFVDLWCTLSRRAHSLESSGFEDHTDVPFGSSELFIERLRAASVARQLLAWRLFHGPGVTGNILKLLMTRLEPQTSARWTHELGGWIRTLVEPRDRPSGSLSLLTLGAFQKRFDQGCPTGGVAAMLGAPTETLGELWLAHRGMRELLSPDDMMWAKLFWQYQRVRTACHRWVVQDPGTAGLGWFSRHYLRIKTLAGSRRRKVARSVELEKKGLGLHSFEGRTGFPDDHQEYAELIADCAGQSAEREIGVVFHWIKSDRKHLPSNNGDTLSRYGDWTKKATAKLRLFEDALERKPWLILFVRAVDVANFELEIPNWVIKPLYQRARRAARKAAAYINARKSELLGRRSFFATAHAGEDFGCLQEGVRRLGELLGGDFLQQNDRLGHAIALGTNPRPLTASHQAREERLFDILFEIDLIENGDIQSQHNRSIRLRKSAKEHATVLGNPSVDHWLGLRRSLHDPNALRRIGYPYVNQSRAGDGALENLRQYLTDEGLARRGRCPVVVPCGEQEILAVQTMQNWVRDRVSDLELTIETNPSSNLLVGDFGSFEDHPAWRLREPTAGECPLPVSINDDDPITFATRLADEYAYLQAELAGHRSVQDVHDWLARARRDGWSSRFTVSLQGEHQLLRELVDARHMRP